MSGRTWVTRCTCSPSWLGIADSPLECFSQYGQVVPRGWAASRGRVACPSSGTSPSEHRGSSAILMMSTRDEPLLRNPNEVPCLPQSQQLLTPQLHLRCERTSRATTRKACSTGERLFRHQTSAVSTVMSCAGSASGRYLIPSVRRRIAEAGTRETPRLAATNPCTIRMSETSCVTRGLKPQS
jgi:hypothetical protein